jgi:hypothetical protein
MPRRAKETKETTSSPKPWGITQADIDATTPLEEGFATTRCLPPEDIIPEPFWGWYKGSTGNLYFFMADALFCGSTMPVAYVTWNDGFREDGEALMKWIMAHMRSFTPSHEHKIAGIAYMISQAVTLTPEAP